MSASIYDILYVNMVTSISVVTMQL